MIGLDQFDRQETPREARGGYIRTWRKQECPLELSRGYTAKKIVGFSSIFMAPADDELAAGDLDVEFRSIEARDGYRQPQSHACTVRQALYIIGRVTVTPPGFDHQTTKGEDPPRCRLIS
ncbi:hypothetical protein [Ciceribacter sp. L1K23]|uniref:hypothetical protein n=1 Tax=Ciceribacter sp. L1K23 TaxID=2820276 RepID=UPI00201277B1|nr:hypothetical protein [Ciceribacter sp. L1K23]